MKKNKGYTLIEALIVIAIMAILASLSMFSILVIKNAKRQAAVDAFNAQIGNCLVKAKSVSEPYDSKTGVPVGMRVVKRTDGKYAILVGYCDGTNVRNTATGRNKNPENDAECDAVMPKEISDIVYTPMVNPDDSTGGAYASDNMLIRFKKSDGSVVYGAGTYDFYSDGKGNFATITLDPITGNHFIKYN